MYTAAAVASGSIRSTGPIRSIFEWVLTNWWPGLEAAISRCTFGRSRIESSKLSHLQADHVLVNRLQGTEGQARPAIQNAPFEEIHIEELDPGTQGQPPRELLEGTATPWGIAGEQSPQIHFQPGCQNGLRLPTGVSVVLGKPLRQPK